MRVADGEYSWEINGLFGSTTGHEDLGRVNNQLPAPAVFAAADAVGFSLDHQASVLTLSECSSTSARSK